MVLHNACHFFRFNFKLVADLPNQGHEQQPYSRAGHAYKSVVSLCSGRHSIAEAYKIQSNGWRVGCKSWVYCRRIVRELHAGRRQENSHRGMSPPRNTCKNGTSHTKCDHEIELWMLYNSKLIKHAPGYWRRNWSIVSRSIYNTEPITTYIHRCEHAWAPGTPLLA